MKLQKVYTEYQKSTSTNKSKFVETQGLSINFDILSQNLMKSVKFDVSTIK